MAGGKGDTTVEYTPTWVLAVVCAVIVVISLIAERIIHYLGKYFVRRNQRPLFEALQKIKEELMLLGFISLLLAAFEDWILKICMPRHWADDWLPCEYNITDYNNKYAHDFKRFSSSFSSFISTTRRRLLAPPSTDSLPYCERKGKVSVLSIKALHHLHVFIFVLAAAHVIFSALTMVFASLKIRQWKSWEESAAKDHHDVQKTVTFTNVQEHAFVKGRFKGIGKKSALLSWLCSFFKQFVGSVTESDYTTLRLSFIYTHCRGIPNYNFYKYMTRALEADFKKVVGIRWYLWIFVVLFLFLNVSGWNALFWISLFPLLLLLGVGTKLEHVLSQLGQEVAEKHIALEGDLLIRPSDHHFWFRKPHFILVFMHIILFMNSFELAYIIWILLQYKYGSCIVGTKSFFFARIAIGVLVQFLCSCSTLPLYAIVTQMGSSFKKEIFEEHIQMGLVGWVKNAKKKKKKGFKILTKKAPKEDSRDNSDTGGEAEEIEIEIVSTVDEPK